MIDKIFWAIRAVFMRLSIKRIGLITYIGKPIHIYGGRRIFIGNKVRIFPGLRAETHNKGEIVIEDNISIGQNCHITSSGEKLVIHKNTTVSGSVFVTNIDHDYTQIGLHIQDQKYIVKTTSIGENCFIGFGVAIQAGTILGKQCVVGANSVVRGKFPDYSVIVGAPARIVKRYNILTESWERTDKNGEFIT